MQNRSDWAETNYIKNKELIRQNESLSNILNEKNELLEEIKILRTNIKTKEALERENSSLHKIVGLFLHRKFSNSQKKELLEIYQKHLSPYLKSRLIIEYMNKLGKNSHRQAFSLSEDEKSEIRNIIGNNQNKEDGFQELFNYINYVVGKDEKNISRWIRKKTRYL